MKFQARRTKSVLPMLVVMAALAACGKSHPTSDNPSGQVSKLASAAPLQLKLQSSQPEATIGIFKGCNIEAMDASPFQGSPLDAESSHAHVLAGWIADPGLAHASYWLRFENKSKGLHYQAPLSLTIKRPDVVAAAASKGSVPLNSGFEEQLPAQSLPAGQYHAYVAAMQGAQASVCDNGREIVVR